MFGNGIKIRMGAGRHDFSKNGQTISFLNFNEKQMSEASSTLIAFLQKKGFFRV